MKDTLPRGQTVLSQDDRPIKLITWPNDPAEPHYRVGDFGVTEIVAYDEFGEMANVPWVAVFKGDAIVLRTAARHVDISYV